MPNGIGEARGLGRGLVLLALLLPTVAGAQGARIRASFDRDEMALDDTATLIVRVDAPEAPDSMEWPKSAPFKVLSQNKSTQSSFSLGGGAGVQVRQTVIFELTLQPDKTGVVEFPPVAAVVRGKRIVSEPARVRVLPAGSRPKTPPTPQSPAGPLFQSPFGGKGGGGAWRGWEKDLRLVLELDRKEAFVGQQVTATVSLVSPVPVRNVEPKAPSFDGFWAESVATPQRFDFQLKTIDGIPYRVYLIEHRALFPTRAGTIEIGPYEVNALVNLGADSAFDPFPEMRSAQRASDPVSVTVKPLPAGAPKGFETVNVGKLALDATVSDTAVQAGQPITVRLTARGEANVKTLSLPRLPDLPDVRRFDPVTKDEVAPQGVQFAGSRTEEIVIVPERAGDLEIPAISWPIFEPELGRYEVLNTTPLRVKVLPGAAASPILVAGTNALSAGLRPIRSEGALARVSGPSYRGTLYLVLLALPVFGYASVLVALRVRERSSRNAGERRTRSAGRQAKKRLKEARLLLEAGEREAFLQEVERALTGFAADRLRTPVSGLTREGLAKALTSAGANQPGVKVFSIALDSCDAVRFGLGLSDGEALLQLAEQALFVLDQSDWARSSRAA